MSRTYDVAVVGAGPGGSATAALLASRGYEVVLFDRAEFPRDKACAEYCSPGVEDVLRRMGAWETVAREHPRSVVGMTVWIGGRPSLPVRYGAGWRSRFAFTLPRLQLDAALLRYARSRGVEVMEKHRCTGVRMESSGAVLEMDRLNSGAVRFRSKVLVGADGLSSVVCRLLGIDACSRWPRRLGLIAHYDQVEGIDECGEMHVGPGTYCGLAPLPEGRVNVGLVMPLPAGGDGLRLESRFEAAIRTMPEVAAKLDRGRRIKRIRGMGPMSRRVASTAGLGYLLVGDAAGFLDPFTGEGIYRALRGAELAAETIDHALQRIRAEAAPNLAEYARAREREFAGKERVTWLVQAGLAFPPLLETLCTRSRGSTVVAQTVGNVLGDVGQSSTLLKPWIAARLLLPA